MKDSFSWLQISLGRVDSWTWYKNKSKKIEDSSSLSITVFSPCLPRTDTYIIYLQPEDSALSSSWDNPTVSVRVLGAPSPQRLSSGYSYAVISLVSSDPGVASYAPWNLLSILMTEHLFSMCLCPSFFPSWTGTLFWPLDHSWEPSSQVLSTYLHGDWTLLAGWTVLRQQPSLYLLPVSARVSLYITGNSRQNHSR